MAFAVERRGGYPWAEGYHNRNDDRPLPCALTNHGTPTVLPLDVFEDLAAAAATIRAITLRLVLWSAFPTDALEVRLNDQPLHAAVRDPEWQDSQVYSDQAQLCAGARASYVLNPSQRLLRLDYAVAPTTFRVGQNEVAVRVLRRGPHPCGGRGTLIEIEKVEAWVLRRPSAACGTAP